MESIVEKLKRVGLTEYEAKAYVALLNTHLSTATQVSEKAGVPRTKIYSVLESLKEKGWVRIYSGVPLLFKAVNPMAVFDQIKEDYTRFLESAETMLKEKVNNMKEKFVIKKFDITFEGLKDEVKKAKTVEINNATASFVKKISDAFRSDAKIRILLYPGENKPSNLLNLRNVEYKQADMAIVTIIRNKEVPSMSIVLDESRIFTAFEDPVDHRYIVDEMLYDECQRCFAEWSSMGWNSDR